MNPLALDTVAWLIALCALPRAGVARVRPPSPPPGDRDLMDALERHRVVPLALRQVSQLPAMRGLEPALLAAQAGNAVCVNYAANAEAAEATVAEIIAAGGRAIGVQTDTSVAAEVARMFDIVDAELGSVTGLVNNAGIHGPRGPVKDLTEANIRRVLEVNVLGYFLCAQQAVRRMSTATGAALGGGKGGAIVNVSSGAAVIGSPGGGVLYAASKGAVNSFSTGLAQEVIGQGIRVNTLAPGLTETDMTRDSLDKRAPATPMGRAGRPEEIAQAILFLLSDAASYIACANLRVSGGKP